LFGDILYFFDEDFIIQWENLFEVNVVNIDNSIEEFLQSLDMSTRSKISKNIDLLEAYGNTLRMPHSKKIMPRLYELRIPGENKVRIFYTFHNNTAVLLHGFVKKSDKLPSREVDIALHKLRLLD
jgi:phage-related protein